jgi:hypothetical protein
MRQAYQFMQNIIHLLALLRFDAAGSPAHVPEAIAAYAKWTRDHLGYVIDAEAPQIMVCLPDPGAALESLHALMHEGDAHGFTVASSLVQAIRATDHVPRDPHDFTERTLVTLLELAGTVPAQEVAISNKLSSLLQLAVPFYAGYFEPVGESADHPVTRVRQRLVLRGRKLPPYRGAMRIFRPPITASI